MITSLCDSCQNHILDELWGEYKCKYFCHVIHNPNELVEVTDCEGYKKKEKES